MAISDFEDYGKTIIKGVLSDTMEARLDSLDAEKDDGIELEDIQRYAYGVTLVEGFYPLITIIGMRETIDSESEFHRMVWYHYSIEIYVTGDDTEKLERVVSRHVRAIVEILNESYGAQGVVDSVEYPPIMSRAQGLFKGAAILFRLLVPVKINT